MLQSVQTITYSSCSVYCLLLCCLVMCDVYAHYTYYDRPRVKLDYVYNRLDLQLTTLV